MSTVIRKQGELVAVGIVMNLINEFCNSYNVGKNMDAQQILECAQLILKDFNDWKLPDVQLCFDRAKAGRYGKIYDRIDCQVIIEFCSAYDLERQQDIVLTREKESGEVKQIMKQPIADLAKVKLKERPYQEATKKERLDMSELFNKFYRQFDMHHRKNGIDSGGMRFVKRYGQIMDGVKYVEFKIEQMKRVYNYLKDK